MHHHHLKLNARIQRETVFGHNFRDSCGCMYTYEHIYKELKIKRLLENKKTKDKKRAFFDSPNTRYLRVYSYIER